ncbi:MAG: helix-turn-helix transcriptional regulator [Clostridia bacterium]|nr:helix-turn-helix transcriptional regulator [Clostridia bacterium]
MCKYDISAKLTELRAEKGVTQEDVALALSVSNKTVSKWETGASAPDIDMLIALSRYYDVTVDRLLGLENGKADTSRIIADEFKGLNDRSEIGLRIFDLAEAIFPAACRSAGISKPSTPESPAALPNTDTPHRNQISYSDVFGFTASNDDVNLAVVQLRNRSDFAWLFDEKKQENITKLFAFLSDTDALKILAFIHTRDCSESFTADYIAKNTGASLLKSTQILDMCCELEICDKLTAHLLSGKQRIYRSYGDGLILSLISLAFERMSGFKHYHYNFAENCKMIGGNGK